MHAVRRKEIIMTVQDQLDPGHDDVAPGPVLVTVKDAARMLAISRSTVYELISAGKLQVVHIGRSARVPVAAVVAYADGLRGGASGATGRRGRAC
jgi:excisionase family DNA binding protein